MLRIIKYVHVDTETDTETELDRLTIGPEFDADSIWRRVTGTWGAARRKRTRRNGFSIPDVIREAAESNGAMVACLAGVSLRTTYRSLDDMFVFTIATSDGSHAHFESPYEDAHRMATDIVRHAKLKLNSEYGNMAEDLESEARETEAREHNDWMAKKLDHPLTRATVPLTDTETFDPGPLSAYPANLESTPDVEAGYRNADGFLQVARYPMMTDEELADHIHKFLIATQADIGFLNISGPHRDRITLQGPEANQYTVIQVGDSY